MSEEKLIICRNCGQSLLDDGDESMVWKHADGSRWCRDGRAAEPYGHWPDYRKAESVSGEPPRCISCNQPLVSKDGKSWCSTSGCFAQFQPVGEPPRSEPPEKIKMGFLVRIEMHTKDAELAITSPEALRFQIGHMMDSWGIQEEVDYTLEVSRTYENE